MEIQLNGEVRDVPPEQSVQALVDQLGLTGQALAVAINREIVPRPQWPQRTLQAHDRVDLVRPVGGG
jgi:sulfur carrier protein